MLRVVIVDDHPAMRSGLRALVEAEADLVVAAEVSDGASAVRSVIEERPDVVLFDLSMSGVASIDVVRVIAGMPEGPGVVALSMERGGESLAVATAAGARGFVVKTDADRELVAAIRAVAAGESHYPGRPPPLDA